MAGDDQVFFGGEPFDKAIAVELIGDAMAVRLWNVLQEISVELSGIRSHHRRATSGFDLHDLAPCRVPADVVYGNPRNDFLRPVAQPQASSEMQAHDGDQFIFDCFERIRDTAADMREALERGDWDAVGRAIAREWENRKQLAPGVTTPAIEGLIARATAAGATAAKVCGAGGGGCMFCYGPPGARAEIAAALAGGGARVLDYTFERHGLARG